MTQAGETAGFTGQIPPAMLRDTSLFFLPRSGASWRGKLERSSRFRDDAVAAADHQDCAHRATVQAGRTKSFGGAANAERWSRRPLSTSLVVDECLWAAVFRLDGWLVCEWCFFARTR